MTFRDVVIKNFKGSFHKYLSYFLSSCFCIMLFFMNATIMLNKDMASEDELDVISFIFPITMVAIALFSIFFINYAHSAFIKGRNKEFGIYISLGVNSKDIRKLINMESMIINFTSLLIGIGVGVLFSRLFQMIILSLFDVKNIKYYLDYSPFLITITVFVFIFATVMARTFLKMRKLDISSLLAEVRSSEGRKYSKRDPIFGGLGLILMACSVVFLVIIANKEKLNSNPLVLMTYMAGSFLGVFLVLSNGGNLILHILGRSRFYHKNLLTFTQLHYKFNQNKKIIFILSVLSTMTIFLVASPFSLLSLSETIAEMAKNHLEYVETDTINVLPKSTLDRILSDDQIVSNSTVKFIYLSTKKASSELSDCKPIIAVTEYNNLTDSKEKLQKGQALNIGLDWMPGNQGIEPGSKHELYAGSDKFTFEFTDSHKGNWITDMNTFSSASIVVINDIDYGKILEKITNQNIGYYHLINFKNWKKSNDIVNKLRLALGENDLKPIYILDNYTNLRNAYSVFLFVSTVMGIMFFVAGGSVLYFKQFTELSEARVTFKKLFKIGITDKEMRGIIGKELFIVFFFPLLFGSYLGLSLIYLMTYIVGGDAIIGEFIRNALVGVAIYFISQGVYYLITRSKYIGEIIKG